MSESYSLKEHREWIGLLQPVGLVVSPTALERAQLRLQKDVFDLQTEFRVITDDAGLLPLHLPSLFIRVLGWRKEDLFSGEAVGDLNVYLPEREVLLRADFAVKNVDTQSFEILIKELGEKSFDEDELPEGRGWQASPHSKFERHLREKNISIGILVNRVGLRLVYAPKGETSGYLTFPFAFMRETQGRPVLAALHLLLGEDRLFKGDPSQRLPALLIDSRKFQNDVSTQLSEQVLAALYELLRGLQEADDDSKGRLLKDVLARDKNEVYHGLLTVLLRIVFLLYAEDRDLLSNDPVFLNNYSINGLFSRLREDYSRHHDTMNFRYGAWSHLISMFRLIYEGVDLESDTIPGRKGHLFDPDRFPFLEGQSPSNEAPIPARISDGVVWRTLENLMTLDGERISYRALDVEQIGSVYETVMGFRLEVADGPSIAIKAAKPHGAPVTISLLQILGEKGEKRVGKIKELTDHKFDAKAVEAIKKAKDPEELVIALGKKIAEWATPTILAAGSILLQPSDERRRSGSHYTPRSLTAPIVAKALEPLLVNLGQSPTPAQILDLKICDPAMGSGAFLVEVCRQLSELLVKAWATHQPDIRKEIPPDEDELLYARRLIAQRCLYGVDRNRMAVNLAKLSLWLATFARNHEFTFLDHCLKCGDSLVGLDQRRIASMSWLTGKQPHLEIAAIKDKIQRAEEFRKEIRLAGHSASTTGLSALKAAEDEQLVDLRVIGDLVVRSYFSASKEKDRQKSLAEANLLVENRLASGASLQSLASQHHFSQEAPNCFHWEIEFPEVFSAARFGFDCVIGNPPFLGGMRISGSLGDNYLSWLHSEFEATEHRCDLVAYFFRRAYELINAHGTVAFIATNTISQGDTREGSLQHIVGAGGAIYFAIRRLRWPGQAKVIVSIVCYSKGVVGIPILLDGRSVQRITPFLIDKGGNVSPRKLKRYAHIHHQGSITFGPGFLFDDADEDANPTSKMAEILEVDPSLESRIRPYLGGEEVNSDPEHRPNRHVIYLSDLKTEEEVKKFPALYEIVKEKVKPQRDRLPAKGSNIPLIKRWWSYQAHRPELYAALEGKARVMVTSQTSKYVLFTFLPTGYVYSAKLIVILFHEYEHLCVLQSRVHEIWALKFGSTMKNDPVYTATDCFETFPMTPALFAHGSLRAAGQAYFEFRAALMVRLGLGLTKLYNQFHDPNVVDEDILRLRTLHDALDEAVFLAFGWLDIKPEAKFVSIGEQENGGEIVRYRWSLELEDEVIGRLMELNSSINISEGSDEQS